MKKPGFESGFFIFVKIIFNILAFYNVLRTDGCFWIS
jgi:hypothetical protein